VVGYKVESAPRRYPKIDQTRRSGWIHGFRRGAVDQWIHGQGGKSCLVDVDAAAELTAP
jgi:hypothetical protein